MLLVLRILLILATVITVESAFASDAKFPSRVRKGEITVFGYTLRSKEIRAIKGEYFVSFDVSPNKRWVVILYDEPFDNVAVWLYDKTTKAAPKFLKAKRFGRHIGVEWYGDDVFAIFGAGMGYQTSRLFRVENVDQYKDVDDIVVYDAERDIYALLNPDKKFNYFIVVGRAFHTEVMEERFLIPLYDKDLTGAIDYVEKLIFTDTEFTVTYKNKDEKEITETFKSKLIENAKP
jgi:hypothetical protein